MVFCKGVGELRSQRYHLMPVLSRVEEEEEVAGDGAGAVFVFDNVVGLDNGMIFMISKELLWEYGNKHVSF